MEAIFLLNLAFLCFAYTFLFVVDLFGFFLLFLHSLLINNESAELLPFTIKKNSARGAIL